MHRNAWVLGQPLLNDGMLVGGIVVGDQMQRLVFGRFAVNFLEEFEPLHMGVALLACADERAVQSIHGSEQGRGSIAHVIVRHGFSAPLFQRQSRLGSVQCLHLTFLVAAQNQRMLGRRHVQADDVFKFFHKLRVT